MLQFRILNPDGTAQLYDYIDPVIRIYNKDGKLIVVNSEAEYEYPIDTKYVLLECEYDDENLCYIYKNEEEARRLGIIKDTKISKGNSNIKVRYGITLHSYSAYDDTAERDYMAYMIKYADGHCEYISRELFHILQDLLKKGK